MERAELSRSSKSGFSLTCAYMGIPRMKHDGAAYQNHSSLNYTPFITLHLLRLYYMVMLLIYIFILYTSYHPMLRFTNVPPRPERDILIRPRSLNKTHNTI